MTVENRPNLMSVFLLVCWLCNKQTNCTTAVWQEYETRVNDEFVLRGNSALLKCLIPSYVGDVVSIEAWVSDRAEMYQTASQWGT